MSDRGTADLLDTRTFPGVNRTKLNVREAAALVGLTPQALYELINDGIVPAYRPSPRRTWLYADELVAALEVRVEPRPKRERLSVVAAAVAPAAAVLVEARPARRSSGARNRQNVRDWAKSHDPFADLKRAS